MQQQLTRKKRAIQRKTTQQPEGPELSARMLEHPYLPAQSILGNHGVLRRYGSDVIQAKLIIGSPNDKYEQEADRIAEQIMRMPRSEVQQQLETEDFRPGRTPVRLQRQVEAEPEEVQEIREEQEQMLKELRTELDDLEETIRTRYPEGEPTGLGILAPYLPGEATERNLEWYLGSLSEGSTTAWDIVKLIISPVIVPFLVYYGMLEDTIEAIVDLVINPRKHGSPDEYYSLRRQIRELRESIESAEGTLPEEFPQPELLTLPEPPSRNTVYFGFDSNEIRMQDISVLYEHSNYLIAHPYLRVVLEGHADERGSHSYNQDLGKRRADAVLRMLVEMGVSEGQLESVSYGEERLVSSEHAFNRRVEVKYAEY